MNQTDYKSMLKSQQGELDAILMYQALADHATNKKDAEIFRKLAKEEGRHAAVFHNYTSVELRPKKLKATLLPILVKCLGRRRAYQLIANGEYSAAKKYQHLASLYPEVVSVRDDETRHGDMVLKLLL